MRSELKSLQRRTGITFIYVTHDQAEAMALSDRIAVFHRGTVQQVGTPREIYERPANLFVADFMGLVNKISGNRASVATAEQRSIGLGEHRIAAIAPADAAGLPRPWRFGPKPFSFARVRERLTATTG